MVLRIAARCSATVATVAVLASLVSPPQLYSQQADKEVLIEQLLNEVQKGLLQARIQIAGVDFPDLQSVTLNLKTAVTKSVGGTIKIFVFTIGTKWNREESQEMILTLSPPPARPEVARDTTTIANELVKAIVAAANGVEKARTGNPPLNLTQFEMTVSFLVSTEGGGGVNAPFKIIPVTVDLSGSATKAVRHSITLVFGTKT
jgi:hypothetical protein